MNEPRALHVLKSDQQLLPLSALQHLLFCPRQCALIHLEKVWADTRFTAEGNVHGSPLHRGKPSKLPRFERV